MAGRGKLLLSMMAKKKEEEEKTTTTASLQPMKSISPQDVAASSSIIQSQAEPSIRAPTASMITSEQATAMAQSSASGVPSPSLVRKPIPTSMPSPDRHAFRVNMKFNYEAF